MGRYSYDSLPQKRTVLGTTTIDSNLPTSFSFLRKPNFFRKLQDRVLDHQYAEFESIGVHYVGRVYGDPLFETDRGRFKRELAASMVSSPFLVTLYGDSIGFNVQMRDEIICTVHPGTMTNDKLTGKIRSIKTDGDHFYEILDGLEKADDIPYREMVRKVHESLQAVSVRPHRRVFTEFSGPRARA